MNRKIQQTYHRFPKPFWTLMGVTLIDQLGRWLLFPFFALYATQKFGISMTQLGFVLGTFFIAGMIGKLIAGAVSDRFGRRSLIIFGLLVSAGTSLAMGLATTTHTFFLLVGIAGLMSNMGDPAQQAMIADLLPEKQRPNGYSAFRVVFNLATAIGPLIGGILVTDSYLWLFIFDAISSLIAALIARINLPETQPKILNGEPNQTLLGTFKGYGAIANDVPFMLFLVFTTLMVIPYVQTYATLSVYLRDIHGFSPNWYSYLLTLNAVLVICFQFWLTNRLKKLPSMLLMAGGTILIGMGLLLYGLGSQFMTFAMGMLIITLGEMVVAPMAQTLVARFSPENKRGRYAAAYSLTWSLSNAVGPLLAGLVMDLISPEWVWYAAGVLSLISAMGYFRWHSMETNTMKQKTARSLVDQLSLFNSGSPAVQQPSDTQNLERSIWRLSR